MRSHTHSHHALTRSLTPCTHTHIHTMGSHAHTPWAHMHTLTPCAHMHTHHALRTHMLICRLTCSHIHTMHSHTHVHTMCSHTHHAHVHTLCVHTHVCSQCSHHALTCTHSYLRLAYTLLQKKQKMSGSFSAAIFVWFGYIIPKQIIRAMGGAH